MHASQAQPHQLLNCCHSAAQLSGKGKPARNWAWGKAPQAGSWPFWLLSWCPAEWWGGRESGSSAAKLLLVSHTRNSGVRSRCVAAGYYSSPPLPFYGIRGSSCHPCFLQMGVTLVSGRCGSLSFSSTAPGLQNEFSLGKVQIFSLPRKTLPGVISCRQLLSGYFSPRAAIFGFRRKSLNVCPLQVSTRRKVICPVETEYLYMTSNTLLLSYTLFSYWCVRHCFNIVFCGLTNVGCVCVPDHVCRSAASF